MPKKSQPTARVKVDTRGLTADQDPRYFYEYSSQLRQQQSDGLEGLLYKLIPLAVFRLTAYAVDPFAQLKVGAGRVSPGTRYRELTHADVLDRSIRTLQRLGTIDGADANEISESLIGIQSTPGSWSWDSTRKSRLPGSELGEFDLQSFRIASPPNRLVRRELVDLAGSLEVPPQTADLTYIATFSTPSALIDAYDVLQPSEEYDRALAKMQEHSLRLFKRVTPQKRTYTLFRNIAELKDIPRSIASLRASLKSLIELGASLKISGRTGELLHSLKTVQSQVPKEYLSYWFGWRQLYSDAADLLTSPARIGKRIDFLVRRNGKATTYRTSSIISERDVPSAGFTYANSIEDSFELTHSRVRKTELKLVVNTNFEFPPTDLPNFRKKEFFRQIGVVPTPVDIYNLIPWTWLFDWFTGFGHYLEVIENVNSDSSLVNWGLISAIVDVEVKTDYVGQVSWTKSTGIVGAPDVEVELKHYEHSSSLHFHLHLRRDLATIMNVNTTADASHLTPYQLSILGAILTNYAKNTR